MFSGLSNHKTKGKNERKNTGNSLGCHFNNKIRFTLCAVLILLCFRVFAWEPTQAVASKVQLEVVLFEPFEHADIEISIDDEGSVTSLSIATDLSYIDIPAEKLSAFKFPSLADIEVMHYGVLDEKVGIGGTFSLCIPYGKLKRIKDDKFWQRAVVEILVTEDGEHIIDIPHPNEGPLRMGPNGCEVAAQEVYGF